MLALCAVRVGGACGGFCYFDFIVSMLLVALRSVLRSALSVLHFLVNIFDG